MNVVTDGKPPRRQARWLAFWMEQGVVNPRRDAREFVRTETSFVGVMCHADRECEGKGRDGSEAGGALQGSARCAGADPPGRQLGGFIGECGIPLREGREPKHSAATGGAGAEAAEGIGGGYGQRAR